MAYIQLQLSSLQGEAFLNVDVDQTVESLTKIIAAGAGFLMRL